MKAKFVLLGCVGFVVVCAGICGIGSFLFQRQSGDGFTQEIAEAKKAGLPTTAEEFAPPVDPAKNTAPKLIAAAKTIQKQVSELTKKASEPDKKLLQLSDTSWAASVNSNSQVFRKAIATLGTALDDAVAATKSPTIRFVRDYNKGFDVLFPEYAELKSLTKWLSVRALVRAGSGDEAGMAEDLLAMARVSAVSGSDDIFIGYLVQVATEAIGMRAIEQCISVRKGSPGSIRAVREAIKAFGPVPNTKNALRGQYFLSMVSLKQMIANRDPRMLEGLMSYGVDSDGQQPGLISRLLVAPGMLEANAKNALQMTRDNYTALPTDPLDLAKTRAVFDASDRKLLAQEKNPQFLLAQIITPVFANGSEAFVKAAQQRNLMEILLQSLEARSRTGQFPAKLPVKGSLATDLFDGGILRYSVSGGKLKIYSVGADGFDNDGTRQSGGSSKDIDIVVSFPTE